MSVTKASPAVSYSQQAESMLRRLILEGTVQPGQRLNELELSQALGISRSPIREAFQRLAKEGLVELIENRGAFVARFEASHIRELYEVREALEVFAVRQAAHRAEQSQLEHVRRILGATRLALSGQEPRYPSHLDFHAEIVALAGNRRLSEKVAEINAQLRLARGRSGFVPSRAREAYEEHAAIYRALVDRDPERTAELLSEHLRASQKSVWQALGSGIDGRG